MLEALPENDVRYAVIDIFYETSEGSRAEIFFIAWSVGLSRDFVVAEKMLVDV